MFAFSLRVTGLEQSVLGGRVWPITVLALVFPLSLSPSLPFYLISLMSLFPSS
ncbi:hypothetical protein BDV37DRAFT_260879 [Aspergillus pseudonomiae]|uniref:Uncharacterized protein n=1 Tax=Aspergillus pseudonomiae TaxID=1506151 RepID=A0A5N7D0A7_9EURO|nr:uncharacterized protein BDV37DRAFT_260879 [Aspergillus pseudonomiae]KAE8399303.1 hypothetical protein BDV37DRAFT_260879 [Aspergillus pseudonomiae]